MSAILKQKLIDIANGFTKYGLWKYTGSSNLSELDDVTLTNLQSNDVLTYNGSKWVNDDNLQTQIDTLKSNLDDYKRPVSYKDIDLELYTESKPYVSKCDGIVICSCTNNQENANSFVFADGVKILEVTSSTNSNAPENISSCYVKAGTKLFGYGYYSSNKFREYVY